MEYVDSDEDFLGNHPTSAYAGSDECFFVGMHDAPATANFVKDVVPSVAEVEVD